MEESNIEEDESVNEPIDEPQRPSVDIHALLTSDKALRDHIPALLVNYKHYTLRQICVLLSLRIIQRLGVKTQKPLNTILSWTLTSFEDVYHNQWASHIRQIAQMINMFRSHTLKKLINELLEHFERSEWTHHFQPQVEQLKALNVDWKEIYGSDEVFPVAPELDNINYLAVGQERNWYTDSRRTKNSAKNDVTNVLMFKDNLRELANKCSMWFSDLIKYGFSYLTRVTILITGGNVF